MADNYSAKDATSVVQTFRSKDNGTYHVPQSSQAPQPAAAGNKHLPASNTAAVVTKTAAGAGLFNACAGVYWSYSGNPTGGKLTLEDVSGTTVLEVDITAGGPGFLPFSPPIRNAAANTALIVTLAAGGSGITGKLAVNAWVE